MFGWIKRLLNKTDRYSHLRHESASGYKFYSPLEQLHNEHHPAVITPDGTRVWYRYGKVGRLNGSSIETAAGSLYWFDGENLHRNDGPAVEHVNGIKLFYLHGREMTFEEWSKRTDAPVEKKVELALIYS